MRGVRDWYRRHRFAVHTAMYLALAWVSLVSTLVSAAWLLPWWRLAVLVLGAPLQAWFVGRRRRRPLAYPLVAVACTALGDTSHLPLALMSLTLRRRDLVTVAVGAAAVPALALAVTDSSMVQITRNGAPADVVIQWVAGWIFLLVMLVVAPMLWGAFVGARREVLAGLEERARRAEVEQELRAERAVLAERTRIAREMHDVLGHRLALLSMQAGGLEVNPGAGADQVERQAAGIQSSASAALDDLRGILGVLRSEESAVEMRPQPGVADIAGLVETSRAAGARVVLHPLDDSADLPDVVGRAAYRVVQEALTNAHKHAPGAEVTVRVTRNGPGPGADALVVVVHNRRPVRQVPAAAGGGIGLAGLAERVRLAGGRLVTGPDGDGFVVRAEFDLSVTRSAREHA